MKTNPYCNRKSILLVSLILLFMCSCKDSEIAKNMEGTWKRSSVTSYDDGTKSYVDEQITFTYDATATEENDGTFTEISTGQEEEDEDEINAKYRWVSKIEGTWKIEQGTLYMHYNLSTLEVEIGKDDVNLKIKYEAWLWNDWAGLLTAGQYSQQNIYKELKKETYRQLFRSYKSHNDQDYDNLGFSEVKINGNIMSYETSDMGKIKYYRVKKRETQEPNREDGNANKTASLSEEKTPIKLSVMNVEYWENLDNQRNNTYVPSNMIDGNPSTAWAVNLDKVSYDSNKLYGPIFTLRCSKISHVTIRNGYAKNHETYRNNARALQIIICNADDINDEDTSILFEGVLNDTPNEQTIRLEDDFTSNSDIRKVQLVFPADRLKKGDKWNDLCISEIDFYGY